MGINSPEFIARVNEIRAARSEVRLNSDRRSIELRATADKQQKNLEELNLTAQQVARFALEHNIRTDISTGKLVHQPPQGWFKAERYIFQPVAPGWLVHHEENQTSSEPSHNVPEFFTTGYTLDVLGAIHEFNIKGKSPVLNNIGVQPIQVTDSWDGSIRALSFLTNFYERIS